MKKGNYGKVRRMNLHEQFINDLFDLFDYDELTEEECIPIIDALTILEKLTISLLEKQGFHVEPFNPDIEKVYTKYVI